MNKKFFLLFLVCGALFAGMEYNPIFWSRIPVFNRILDTSIEKQIEFARTVHRLTPQHTKWFYQNIMNDTACGTTIYITAIGGALIGGYCFKKSMYNAFNVLYHGGAFVGNVAKKIHAHYFLPEDVRTYVVYHAEHMIDHAISASLWGLITYGAIKVVIPASEVIKVGIFS